MEFYKNNKLVKIKTTISDKKTNKFYSYNYFVKDLRKKNRPKRVTKELFNWISSILFVCSVFYFQTAPQTLLPLLLQPSWKLCKVNFYMANVNKYDVVFIHYIEIHIWYKHMYIQSRFFYIRGLAYKKRSFKKK